MGWYIFPRKKHAEVIAEIVAVMLYVISITCTDVGGVLELP